jgi:hypothetical protein
MKLGNVSVNVVNKQEERIHSEKRNGAEYVIGTHEQQYGLNLINRTGGRVLYDIKIDGKQIAELVMDNRGRSTIWRPTNVDAAFHFSAKYSEEGQATLQGISHEELGLIQVDIYDEVYVPRQIRNVAKRVNPNATRGGGSKSLWSGSLEMSMGTQESLSSSEAAGTMLGRETGQRFGTTTFNQDHGTKRTIYIRLRVEEQKPTYRAIPTSTPYPGQI